MKTFKITISTPTGRSYETSEAIMINANILEGRIGILANHSPLLSSLKISDFNIKLEDGSVLYGVANGGVFNVTKDEVTILTTKYKFKDEVIIKDVQDEIDNLHYQLKGEVLPTEEKILNNRLKYREAILKLI